MAAEISPAPLTAADVARRLRRVGVEVGADAVAVERRGDRVLARLSDGRIAWFATTPGAAASLETEDRVLSLVGARCSFRVPAVLATSPDGWTLRTAVPGSADPFGFAARLKAEPGLVPDFGRTLGLVLAEQHARIAASDVAGWLPTAPPWPPPLDDVETRARRVVDDPGLLDRIGRLLGAGRALDTRSEDRALVHGDFGLHNIAVDLVTSAVMGVFDYGDAAWADRHLDFRYLAFAAVPDALLDAAMAAYRGATGIALDRHHVLVRNALAAVAHLADRAGHGADEVVAGRTLAGDLRWTAWALDRCGFGSAARQGGTAHPVPGAGGPDGRPSAGGPTSDPLAPYLARWRLTPDGDRIVTHSSLLLPVTRGRSRAMLKLALDEEEKGGGALMAWWDGGGAARVLAHDADAVLLKRADEARSLSVLACGGEDEAAIHVICDVLAALHHPRDEPRPPLVPLTAWFRPLEAAASAGGAFASAWVSASRLLADPRDVVVLHGDMHHDNILDFGAEGWRAIDPKGLLGERGYDYANLFRNPSEEVALYPSRFERRVALVSARVGIEPSRLLHWIHAVMGLSAAWQIGEADQPWAPKLSTTLAVADKAAAALGEG